MKDENKDYKFIKAEPKGKKHLWMTLRKKNPRNVMKNPKDKKSHENEAFKREGKTHG